jgi:mannitol/fructose-specific phosphotransferase system IIA component (Ntr-type)/CBS domain-containing protein
VEHASHLVLTLPQTASRAAIVSLARHLNPRLKIFVRARYLRERGDLEQVGATAAIFEEAEAAVALARLVLADTGFGRESIEHAVRDIRTRLILDNVSTLRTRAVRKIMIPWTRVRRLSSSAPLDEVRRQLREQHFSRWPVVDVQTGQPTGYLLAKDLIGLNSDSVSWSSLVRPLASVAPDDDIESTLLQFQREGATICLVRDQGSPAGIVTVEDILEQVIGRMEDEYPRHPKIALRDLIVTDESLLNLSSEASEQAIAEMAAKIPEDRLPCDAKAAELAIAREREIATNLGCGIAIPHARCPALGAPLVVFGRSEKGVLFGEPSPERVHLIFLLLTPADQPDLQVHLLGQIARLAGNSEHLGRLRAASTASEIGEILASADLDGAPSEPEEVGAGE